ncbi:hypothetical protein COB11_06705 [Candidatus Aerophobetes bacterium]|uniref:Integrase catalytic domain-containing protein n=1 Tax=Aerophobetes bacterium TaxID=2030807 RepID=A0A2A4YEI6_UNCAE|nr:MAG: hypothetical protein COB11_06705 [Candidatus Aerophobetes bacterium]
MTKKKLPKHQHMFRDTKSGFMFLDYGIRNTRQENYKAEHRYIPPGYCIANADVESVHAMIEQEFFDLETFNEHQDFILKTQVEQYFYNMVRPNFSKKGFFPS